EARATLVTLDRVRATGLRVGDVPVLGDHNLPLTRTGGDSAKDAISAIWNARLHGTTHDLADEHPIVDPAYAGGHLDPSVDVDFVPVAEVAGSGLQGVDGKVRDESLSRQDVVDERQLPDG